VRIAGSPAVRSRSRTAQVAMCELCVPSIVQSHRVSKRRHSFPRHQPTALPEESSIPRPGKLVPDAVLSSSGEIVLPKA